MARVRIGFGTAAGSVVGGQEVTEHVVAARRQHRLRMELNPLRRQLAVSHPHHHVAEGGGEPKLVGQRRVGDQRVIAAGPKRALEVAEHAVAVVLDLRVLAVDSMAWKTACALLTDSSYSREGMASATVPPPACTWTRPSFTTTVRMWI